VVLGDVVVEALEAALLVPADVEAEAGVEGVLPLVLAAAELALLPEAAEATLMVLMGAKVLLGAALPSEVALEALLVRLALPDSELLWPVLSNPTSVCSRLANNAARPPPLLLSLPASPPFSGVWLLLRLPLEALELEPVAVLAAI
jgi:hypothetical protein